MTATVQQTATSPTQALFASLNPARGSAAGTGETSPQDRFLKLLVTQLKNQDPLNPVDNAQMTSQLAQISTVDGIEKLNATMRMILEGSSENQAMQAAAMIGHSVLVPGSGLALGQGGAAGGIELAGPADRVTVTIRDGSGLTVKTLELGGQSAGARGFTWDGSTDAGGTAAAGAYTVSVAATRGSESVSVSPLQWGTVSSVTRGSQGVSLNVGALGTFNMAEVREIL